MKKPFVLFMSVITAIFSSCGTAADNRTYTDVSAVSMYETDIMNASADDSIENKCSAYSYTIQDVCNLQDFLLARPTDEDLTEKPYDLNGDDRWDVFDLCLMKRKVIGSGKNDKAEIHGVNIDFDFSRMSGKASNQIALWVENESGDHIKTLFVTDFTAARRGYENREDALNNWVNAADPANLTDKAIDAVSSATPQTGHLNYLWDMTDNNGRRVPNGRYFIKLEGTLYWSSSILYTGEIDLNDTNQQELAVRSERSEPDNNDNETMIQNVRMTVMSDNTEIIDNTANWLGGLEPSEALEYMKEHYDERLVIVEVNTDYWKLKNGFCGAMHIPHDEMEQRYNEIPSGVPVILHCGGGIVSVPAYETLSKERKDIPQLSYIAGKPPVSEFNEWLKEHNN
jgi:rhodanese-related sulfurtransferase